MLLTLLLLGSTILALAWLKRQIYENTVLLVFAYTKSPRRAYMAYFLAMLPGIFVHEAAHWLVARLLGLRPGKFRLWPQVVKNHLRLGSITARSGGVWKDSLVGLAPFLAGSLLAVGIGRLLFADTNLLEGLIDDGLGAPADAIGLALGRPDSLLWGYLLFTFANGMMPSESDREPVRPVLIYGALALLLYLITGLPLTPVTMALGVFAQPLRSLGNALFFVVFLDILAWLLLSALRFTAKRRLALP
jgi:hypothetical protein